MSSYDLPEKMTACVLTRPGAFEIQDDIPVPQPGPDEVLCKIRAVAICGSDPAGLVGSSKYGKLRNPYTLHQSQF